jgi:hypothetical protein
MDVVLFEYEWDVGPGVFWLFVAVWLALLVWYLRHPGEWSVQGIAKSLARWFRQPGSLGAWVRRDRHDGARRED